MLTCRLSIILFLLSLIYIAFLEYRIRELYADQQTTCQCADILLNAIPGQIKDLVERVSTEGFEKTCDWINHHAFDTKNYAFLIEAEPPYTYIAHGGNAELVGKTPEQWQNLIFPDCPLGQPCEKIAFVKGLADVANRGGGYLVYKWDLGVKDALQTKISYVLPVEYQGKKYFVGSGCYIN